TFSDTHPILNLPPLNSLKGFAKRVISGVNLQQLVSEQPQDEEKILGATHLLVLTNLISFDKATKVVDITSQIERFKRIRQELQNKNFFETLGVSTKAKSNDIKRAYHELAKVFHPDKLSQGTPEELKTLTRDIFSKMTVAYETLSNDASKA